MSSSDPEFTEQDEKTIMYNKPQISNYKYYNIFHSILQFFLSALLIYVITSVIQLKINASLFILVHVYVLNIYLMYNNPLLSFLSNPIEGKSIKDIIDSYIKAVPLIHIKAESFHYNERNHKEITAAHNEFLKYKSYKDISEVFSIKTIQKIC